MWIISKNWMPYGTSGFLSAIPLGTYAYLGAVSIVTAGSEVVNPRDLPRALIWSSVYVSYHLYSCSNCPSRNYPMGSSDNRQLALY